MTPEELEARLSELEAEKDALKAKNQELITEKRKLKSQFEGIDADKYNALIDEHEALKSNYAKLESTYKSETEKLSNNLEGKDGYLKKVLVEDGLTKSLLEAGVDKQFLKAAMAMLKNDTIVQQNGDSYEAIIGDKKLSEFIPTWMETEGKIFTMKTPDLGAGAKGSGDGGGEEKPKSFREMQKAHFEQK